MYDEPHRFSDGTAARKFIVAGNAYFTLRSAKTGTRFTYRVEKSENGRILFVGVLTGPDNEGDYKYIGTIHPHTFEFRHGRKSTIGIDAPSVKAFTWSWAWLTLDKLPDHLEIWHEGRCGRCGRKLTVPESVENGFGPECVKKISRTQNVVAFRRGQ